MLSATHFPLLAGRRALQRYRAQLQTQLAAEPAFRLLEALTSLPLGLDPLPDPSAILASHTPLALCGHPGSGRSLALLQTAARWAERGGNVPTLYLNLADDDLPHQAPRAVITATAERLGLSSNLVASEQPLLLLLDDWELLPADRRMLWKHFINGERGTWPGLQLVAALPESTYTWPGLHSLGLAAPTITRTQAWLAHLLPARELNPIIAALANGPLQHLLSYGLGDIVLLALTYPINGLPGSRAQLYEHAYVLTQPLLEQLRHREQELNGLTSQPAAIQLGRALLRHERVARALAGGADLATLAHLEPTERRAVAPLVAGLLDDPAPVWQSLWATINEPASLQSLIACFQDAPTRDPVAGLLLLEHLLALTNEPALLRQLEPALPAWLAAAVQNNLPQVLELFTNAAKQLPTPARLWLALLELPTATPSLRWRAAAWLVANPPPFASVQAALAQAPVSSLAPYAYVVAQAYPEEHLRLQHEPLLSGLQELLHTPAATQERLEVVNTLLSSNTLPDELRVLALAALDANDVQLPILLAASPVVRQAAYAVLHQTELAHLVTLLEQVLANPSAPLEAQSDALTALSQRQHPRVAGLLVRTALQPGLALPIRLYATDLIAQQGAAGQLLLQRIAITNTLPTILRSVAVGHLGRLGIAAALPYLAQLLQPTNQPLLQRTAAIAIGALAQQPRLREPAVQALISGLRQSSTDTILAERLIRALGCSGSSRALTALAALLEPQLATLLQRAWLNLNPALEHMPASQWLTLHLPEARRIQLLEVLADGTTLADPPSHLRELAQRQAIRMACTAAAGLADLAVTESLHLVVVRMLSQATARERRPEVARALLDALARITDPAKTLAELLHAPSTDPSLAWLAVERLARDPATCDLLLVRLNEALDPPLVQTQMITTLGATGHRAAVPTLRRLASTTACDPQIRQSAVVALGKINDTLARTALTALIANAECPVRLRATAVTALPGPLSYDERTLLRQSLRRERPVPELASALARVLALSGDHDASSLVLADAQSDQPAVALAGIETLASLGDPAVSPILVRISHNPALAASIRLSAISALLRLDEASYRTLLNEYLDAPVAALRIQAHAALASYQPDDPRLISPLNDPQAPLVLQLQALGHLASHNPDDPLLATLVCTTLVPAQLRLAAASALAQASQPLAVTNLVAALEIPLPDQQPLPPILRYHYIHSLGRIAQRSSPATNPARLQLAALAIDPAQPAEHHLWAGLQLLGC